MKTIKYINMRFRNEGIFTTDDLNYMLYQIDCKIGTRLPIEDYKQMYIQLRDNLHEFIFICVGFDEGSPIKILTDTFISELRFEEYKKEYLNEVWLEWDDFLKLGINGIINSYKLGLL